MEIEEIVGAFTVRVVDPVTPPMLADTVLVPGATPVAKPLASTVTTAVVMEVHVTRDVRSLLLPSVYVPVAENCCVVLTGIELAAGATLTDARLAPALVTLRVAVPVIVPDCAVINTIPGIRAFASPPLLIVATLASELDQVSELVTTWLLPSEYWPVAVNCWLNPGATDATPGDKTSETRDGVVVGGGGVLPPPPPPDENVAEPPLPQAMSAARQHTARIKVAVFTLVSLAPKCAFPLNFDN
jgi:hypothetical protein